MECTKCSGNTKVIERRKTRRRRECIVCQYRFTTLELLANDVPKITAEKSEPVKSEPVKPATVEPKKDTPKKDTPPPVSAVKRNGDARRKIEEMRESKRFRDDFDYLDPDFDYLPEKW